jgi:hypothetical protein
MAVRLPLYFGVTGGFTVGLGVTGWVGFVAGCVGFVAGCVGFVVFSVVGRGGWVDGVGPEKITEKIVNR